MIPKVEIIYHVDNVVLIVSILSKIERRGGSLNRTGVK